MRFMKWSSLVAACGVAGVVACGFDEPVFPEEAPTEEFVATLSPANEIPPVVSSATGSAVIAIIDDSILSYRVDVADIDSTTLAHIHAGPADSNGVVIVDLFLGSTVNCKQNLDTNMTVVSSSIGDPTTIKVAGRHGRTGVFLVRLASHTGATPSLDGEHLATVTGDSTFTVPVAVTAGGTGGTARRFTLINTTSPRCQVDYTGPLNQSQVKYSALTKLPTAWGATPRERFDTLLARMRTGDVYVNVHNRANAAGHMRGQVGPR
jgi:CHRD domain